jgi:hypothetical protein
MILTNLLFLIKFTINRKISRKSTKIMTNFDKTLLSNRDKNLV